MAKDIKVVKSEETCVNPDTHKRMKMTLISKVEFVKIGKLKFSNTHYYYVKPHDNRGKLYPYYKHPTYNTYSDYKKYRRELGLMYPQKINRLRNYWGLNLRDVATLTGISYSTLSEIERGKRVQNIAQNNLLKNLEKPSSLYELISNNLRRLLVIRPAHVNVKKIEKIALKIGAKIAMLKNP